jgi:hypothetical protein
MKRTKRELVIEMENLNKNNITQMMALLSAFAQKLDATANTLIVLRTALKQRGIIDDLTLAQVESALHDMEKMQKEALIIGGDKK